MWYTAIKFFVVDAHLLCSTRVSSSVLFCGLKKLADKKRATSLMWTAFTSTTKQHSCYHRASCITKFLTISLPTITTSAILLLDHGDETRVTMMIAVKAK